MYYFLSYKARKDAIRASFWILSYGLIEYVLEAVQSKKKVEGTKLK